MSYLAEQLLQPRSFVLSGNKETMVLQSQKPETRLTFLNTVSASSPDLLPKYVFSFSNQDFNLLYNSNEIATFREHPTLPTREAIFHGTTRTSNIELLTPTQKGIILQDYNNLSANQYAGFGINNADIIYQLPTRTFRHVFQAAVHSGGNAEWMRIQESANGIAQVGIGTTNLLSTDALAVQGNTSINGDLLITGSLNMLNSPFVQVDPNTQRISNSALPEKVPILNTDNKLDESVLPTSYNFQYLKAQKNIGIGTRNPMQKLHVWGSAAISERIGIGTTNPVSRLDVFESGASTTAVTVTATGGGDAIRIQTGNSVSPSIIAVGSHPGVGIGTSIVQLANTLEVGGDAYIHGNVTCTSMELDEKLTVAELEVSNPRDGIIFKTELVRDATTNIEYPHVFGRARFDFENGISTNEITSYSGGLVRFKDTSIRVDGDTFLARQALTISDMRHKFEILRIENALSKLERMRGYTYHLGDGQREAGVIAQEVLQVFPEAVSTNNKDRYAVRYDSVMALLIEAFHDLNKRLRMLEMK